jgi:gluconolactonase
MEWEAVAKGYRLAEAPTIDVDGSLLFSDVLGGGIYRLTADGAVTEVVPKRRGVGGIAIHADGGIVCSGRDLVHILDGETRTVLHVDGVAGWNDICTDADGNVYAGALRFAVFDPNAEEVAGELWRVGTGPIVDGVVHANGVAVAGDTIYLSDTRRRVLIVVDKGERREIDVSALGHPDGLAIDEHGAIWLALVTGGIARLTPDGKVEARYEPPSNFIASLCFDGRDLYATGDGVFRTTVAVGGMPVRPARV